MAETASSPVTGVVSVTAERGGRPVLHELTVLADEGELLVILGPSGSGKTTLLRCIAGLERPSTGEVLIRGRPMGERPPHERGVAMVFEATELIPFLDVAENMGWGLRVRHVPRDLAEERVADRARRLGLGRLLRRRADALSAGERGTVGIGRALVATPDAFLLDEPLAHLDPGQRARVRRQIVDVVRAAGVTTLYVTHDPVEAMAVADRIAVLHEGRLVQLDRPTALYRRPGSVLVAGSVGTPAMGFLAGRLIASAGLAAFDVGSHTLPLWAPVPEALAGHVGSDVVLGLRAGDVVEAGGGLDGPHRADRVVLPATVVTSEYTGRHTVVTVDVVGSPLGVIAAPVLEAMPLGATLRALFRAGATVPAGRSVQVAVDATRAHVFDAVTGRALWHPDEDERTEPDPPPA